MKERTNHRWEVFDDKSMIYKCKHCGNFMRKRAFTGNTDTTMIRDGSGRVINLVGSFVQRYSLKGSSKWTDEMPECKNLPIAQMEERDPSKFKAECSSHSRET